MKVPLTPFPLTPPLMVTSGKCVTVSFFNNPMPRIARHGVITLKQ